jgi:DNA modification methylase
MFFQQLPVFYMTDLQLPLPITYSPPNQPYQDVLVDLLHGNLDFHNQGSGYATHNFHAFPAKFPPQLPQQFINALTNPGDIILDPMQGSGTTILEALLSGRRGIGFDIDPLAQLISLVKTTPLNAFQVLQTSKAITRNATQIVYDRPEEIFSRLENRWTTETREFVDYWFEANAQIELMALIHEIEKVSPPALRNFYKLAFSAIIITKSGGVSLALDLAHTRPHRAKLVYSRSGEILEGQELVLNPIPNLSHMTKTLHSPLEEFEKRVLSNVKGLLKPGQVTCSAQIIPGNAQAIPLSDCSVDLIITSPPYASNAIDYMRAHKFSLVWLGYPVEELGGRRGEYIGGELLGNFKFEPMPEYSDNIVTQLAKTDRKKGAVLHRYYSEMTRALREMYRVLKPGRAAVVVVGTSQMRGIDTETQNCLADIGCQIGFDVPAIGVRNLDRNRRMMPAGNTINQGSRIQQRMHQEYVIGLYKP